VFYVRSLKVSFYSIQGTINAPYLSPILGSPSKASERGDAPCAAVMQWEATSGNGNTVMSSRAVTVPANLCQMSAGGTRRSVVATYGAAFERSGSFSSRRHSSGGGKENVQPCLVLPDLTIPPPDLSEETLMAPEHNEVLAKLKFIGMLVDTIIDVARCKAAPLSTLTESCLSGPWDANSPLHRRLQQLLLYMRCLHLLSQTLDFARTELRAKKLKPSTSVKNGKLRRRWSC
jgi:hypothetical protein